MRLAAIGSTLCLAFNAHAVELTSPAQANVGETIKVHFTGEAARTDFISIDTKGAADRDYGPYAYPARSNPVTIRAPDTAGAYEVRYHLGSTYAVVASAPLTLTAVAATLEFESPAPAGGKLAVRWTGPNYAQDFISIDDKGAAERSYGRYAYPASGNPVSIQLPDAPGEYDVRYHLGQSYDVIGTAPLTVRGVDASLEAVDTIGAGGAIEVRWRGPNNPQDFISIDATGAGDRDYGPYAYPALGNPVSIRVPDLAGAYVLRYHTGQTYTVLAQRALNVTPVTATLSAPAEVIAGSVFNVEWQGPDNEGDFITLVPVATQDDRWGESNGYPKRGNPLRIQAARTPGDYEVRYLMGQSHTLLARAPVKVVPDATSGQLRVLAADNTVAPAYGAVELVIDASGSMLARLAGERRIDLAKRALAQLLAEIAAGTPLAMRVFGARQADACLTDLEVPLAPLDVVKVAARINAIEPKNLAKTPIGASLLKVKEDLAGNTGPALVVLVTDGEETCDGDPQAAIEDLRAAGLDVRVNIVGFAIDEIGLKETFQSWAQAGNGAYFDAQNA
ncbi:MAG: VWA domain-containing protein, partial [Gammaproteobacteria bacterium]|nr:VWA domain-containing protein [Gammaproteobacteria bacterium]